MDAPERGALMLVRFIAAALVGWAMIDLTLYWVVAQHNHAPLEILPCVLKSIPAVAGFVILVKARAIAQWLSNKMDE